MILLIFEWVDYNDLLNVSLVCKDWAELAKQQWIPSVSDHRVREITQKNIDRVELLRRYLNVFETAKGWSSSSQGRVSLLTDVLTEMQEDLRERLADGITIEVRHDGLYPTLLVNLFRVLGQIKPICASVASWSEIPSNFDTCSYSVRKIFCQLRAIYPLDAKLQMIRLKTQSDILTDRKALELWVRMFGPDTYLVPRRPFFSYLRHLTKMRVLPSQFVCFIRYLLDFPPDNMVSIYKLHCLVSMFGPSDQLYDNIEKYALRRGFIGVQNQYTSEQLLLEHVKRGCTTGHLLRLSARVPECLTCSFIINGKLSHRRQGDSIRTFLEKLVDIPIGGRIPEALDFVAAVSTDFSQYCSSDANYQIPLL